MSRAASPLTFGFSSLLVVFVALVSAFFARAQEAQSVQVEVSILRDADTLILYFPAQPAVPISGMNFRQSQDPNEVPFRYDLLTSFDALDFGALETPVCLRLLRSGAETPLPQACTTDGVTVQTAELFSTDVFWYANNQQAGLRLMIDEDEVGICPSGKDQCPIVFQVAGPIITATPTPIVPTATLSVQLDEPVSLVAVVSDVYVRSMPRNNSRRLTSLERGTISRQAEQAENLDENYWVAIELGGGQTGYVAKDFVQVVSAIPVDGETASANIAQVNARSAPIFGGSTLFSISSASSTPVTVLWVLEDESWLYVDYNGVQGWVLASEMARNS
jgi:hypothetical protein